MYPIYNMLLYVSDVPLVIYLHGGYWQFLRYSVMLSVASVADSDF